MSDVISPESKAYSRIPDDPWPVIVVGCIFVIMGVSAWVQAGFEIFSPSDIGDRGSGMFFLRSLFFLGLPSAFVILGKGLIEGSARCFDWSRIVLWLIFVGCCLKVVLTGATEKEAATNRWVSTLIVSAIAVLVFWGIKQLDRWQPSAGYNRVPNRLWLCVALASALVFLPVMAESNSLKKEMNSIRATRVLITAVDADSGLPLTVLKVEAAGLEPRDFRQTVGAKQVGDKLQAMAELRWISDKPETWWVESSGYERQKIVIQFEEEMELRLVRADGGSP